MEVPNREDLASHTVPESCGAHRDIANSSGLVRVIPHDVSSSREFRGYAIIGSSMIIKIHPTTQGER